ncbi:alpha/beta hydrolase [Paenibacillus sp. O199]|uniref:alpha/beta hydrolase n=1 Tax=Paenibacillus sp. O199 TaxID=1643925 RepID=UPI0007BF327E|nr:alpha/beta hydrolase [Paenibacillus sp. O199]
MTSSNDGVLNREAWGKAKPNLPKKTTFESIKGGNHDQFGSYGMQKRDSVPKVTGQEQLQQIVQALKEWMKSVQK